MSLRQKFSAHKRRNAGIEKAVQTVQTRKDESSDAAFAQKQQVIADAEEILVKNRSHPSISKALKPKGGVFKERSSNAPPTQNLQSATNHRGASTAVVPRQTLVSSKQAAADANSLLRAVTTTYSNHPKRFNRSEEFTSNL